MNRAYTVNPVYQETETGEQIVDLEVTTGNSFNRNIEADLQRHYVEDSNGNMHFQDVEDPEQKMHMGQFDKDDYFGTVAETTPGMTDMVRWATDNPEVDPELVEAWNNSMETGDLETFYDTLEILMGMWMDSGKPGETLTEEQTVNKWFEELPQELVDDEMASIEQTGYTPEQAETMAQIASQFQQGSVEHDLLRTGVDMAFGKADFEAASQQLFMQHGVAKVASGYMKLKQLLNK